MGNPDIESTSAVAARASVDHIDKSQVGVGRAELSHALPPHNDYEGGHRWDPSATWTAEEEKRAVRKTDLKLLLDIGEGLRVFGFFPFKQLPAG